MAGIKDYSTTPSSNDGLGIFDEGQAPNTVNNGGRQAMADSRDFYENLEWRDWGHTPTRTGNTTFTVTGDQTAIYTVGRRIKCTDTSTLYGTITESVYTTLTAVTVELDSGNLSASLSAVALGIDPTNNTIGGISNQFKAHEAETPDMTVLVDAGKLKYNDTLVTKNQQTATIDTADATNPRIDRIVLSADTGIVSVIKGTAASSPSAPAFTDTATPALTSPAIPVCQVSVPALDTAITNDQITDERSLLNSSNIIATGSYTTTSIGSGLTLEVLSIAAHGLGTDDIDFGGTLEFSDTNQSNKKGACILGVVGRRVSLNASAVGTNTLTANPASGDIGAFFYNAGLNSQTITLHWWARTR